MLVVYLRFLPPVSADSTVCPTLRSRPCLVVGIPVLRASLFFRPLMPTARFKENVTPLIVYMLIRLQRYCFFLTFAKSFLVLFLAFGNEVAKVYTLIVCTILVQIGVRTCRSRKFVVSLWRFASVLRCVCTYKKAWTVLVHALRS